MYMIKQDRVILHLFIVITDNVHILCYNNFSETCLPHVFKASFNRGQSMKNAKVLQNCKWGGGGGGGVSMGVLKFQVKFRMGKYFNMFHSYCF